MNGGGGRGEKKISIVFVACCLLPPQCDAVQTHCTLVSLIKMLSGDKGQMISKGIHSFIFLENSSPFEII